MRKLLTVSLVLIALSPAPLLLSQDPPPFEPFPPDQLDNLLAPVALYPDPLLAQVLPAATFPDQIDEAARFARAGANPDAIDVQPWDVSVKAVAHYPSVLYMMADRLDWTTALGQAYVNQPDDVMAAVQRLRQEAQSAGNLVTTPQEDVADDDGYVEITPADPQYIYVPVYDPALVFFGSGGRFGGPVISFGPSYPIGVWLNRNWDWPHHRIYYHGWAAGRGGWIDRSRPYIHVNSVYVSDGLRNVTVNRSVLNRPVNYGNLSRYNSVHQNVANGPRGESPGMNVENKVIQRNMNVGDARIQMYRGQGAQVSEPGRPAQNERPSVGAPSRQAEAQGSYAFGGNRSSFTPREQSQRGQTSRAEPVHPAPAPRASSPPPSHSGGGGGAGGGGGHHK